MQYTVHESQALPPTCRVSDLTIKVEGLNLHPSLPSPSLLLLTARRLALKHCK